MRVIVAAKFDTFPAAEQAVERLHAHGFQGEDISTFYIDGQTLADSHGPPPGPRPREWGIVAAALGMGLACAAVGGFLGWHFTHIDMIAVAGAGTGAYIASLWGALWITGKRARTYERRHARPDAAPSVHGPGALLILPVAPEREQEACALLREAGGHSPGRAQGHWRNGKWEDLDLPEQHDPRDEPPSVPVAGTRD
ncbi:membrane protein [Castellaniella ginsengisoli]|uniref:Membrane protein n=1 Tax=Castellaniella ginsengisoli TaxID=546114 RepID=A0AB39ELF7_9BURK